MKFRNSSWSDGRKDRLDPGKVFILERKKGVRKGEKFSLGRKISCSAGNAECILGRIILSVY